VTSVTRPDGQGGIYTDSYTYDANGNMLSRIENGVHYSHGYNSENRLANVTNTDTGESWSFTYDGDGARVKEVYDDGVNAPITRLFLFGGLYERSDDGTTTTRTKYYSLGGQRAYRVDDGDLHFLVTDHLGSTVAVIDASGGLLSEQRYEPFGAARFTGGVADQTDFGYTGQRAYPGFGLADYNARFYSPTLNRFTQPDTIVPGGPQGLNRYSYVFSNPINLVDPSGHVPQGGHCADGVACDYGVGGSVVGGGFNPAGDYSPPKEPLWCDLHPDSKACVGPGNNPPIDPSTDPEPTCDSRWECTKQGNDQLVQETSDVINLAVGVCTHPNASFSEKQMSCGYLIAWGYAGYALILAATSVAVEAYVGPTIYCTVDDCSDESYSVYQYVKDGVVKYVGITKDFSRRAYEHSHLRGWDIVPVRGLPANLSKDMARGIEQALINNYGLGKLGGALENQINSIAISNPIYESMVSFGNQVLNIVP
jgi:RHS repeat-associated protein